MKVGESSVVGGASESDGPQRALQTFAPTRHFSNSEGNYLWLKGGLIWLLGLLIDN